MKCCAGWSRSWNQDCWEKYQQLQIRRSYHSNGRKWRKTKESVCWWKWKRRVKKAGFKLNIQKMKIMAFSSIISWQIGGETMKTVTGFIFLGSKIIADGDCSHEVKRCLLLDQPRQHIKKQWHYFANKGQYSQSYGFSSSCVWMWELDHKVGWTDALELPKNWCSWAVVLMKALESPLDCMEIKPVHPKGNQSWIFIRRTDAEAETPILWTPEELTH